MSKQTLDKSFGKRLSLLRKENGLTMKELAKRIGTSLRAIHYYEKESKFPPVELLPLLAKEFNVTLEELLGVKATKVTIDPKHAALWRNLKKAERLPKKEQRLLVDLIKSLVSKKE